MPLQNLDDLLKDKDKDVKESLKTNLEAKTHIVAEGETLSHIAQKYYGKATPPYYKHIYEHNKDIIGENINIIVPGQKLVIPALPEELK